MTATIHHAMPWDEYTKGGYMGSSALSAWGTMSNERWSHDYLEEPYTGSGSRYTAGGSALDAALTGDPSGKVFAVKPEGMSFATKDGKAWRDEHAECEIIDAAQDREINRSVPLAREALGVLCVHYGVERSLFQTTLRGEVGGLLLQVRPDCMVGPAWVDLKYVNSKAFDDFDRTFTSSRYFLQSGLFHGLGRDAGLLDAPVSFLLVESGTEYPRCEVVEVPGIILEAAWARVQDIARAIVAVRDSAGGFVSPVKFRQIDPPVWALAKIGVSL